MKTINIQINIEDQLFEERIKKNNYRTEIPSTTTEEYTDEYGQNQTKEVKTTIPNPQSKEDFYKEILEKIILNELIGDKKKENIDAKIQAAKAEATTENETLETTVKADISVVINDA